jgi:FkbM family methyltransferase
MPGSLKKTAQTFLKRIGLYQRLKSSRLYDLYWSLADRTLLAGRNGEVGFYQRMLAGFQKGDLIFDVGANKGYKADIFLRLGARVVAVDPDDTNQQVLRQRFLQYRLAPKPVLIEGKAVSDSIGIMTLWIDAPGSAKNTLNPKWVDTLRNDEKRFGQHLNFTAEKKVETTTLDRLMEIHGTPFFIKIDVEGHEPSVLRGLKRPVPYLSFEVNLPEFKAEGTQCIQTLHAVFPAGEFNYATDCQHGMKLEKWLPQAEFIRACDQCQESTIEVFWRTNVRPGASSSFKN